MRAHACRPTATAVRPVRVAQRSDLLTIASAALRLAMDPAAVFCLLTGRLRTKVRVHSVVDAETRRQVALARLAALELDNYVRSEASQPQPLLQQLQPCSHPSLSRTRSLTGCSLAFGSAARSLARSLQEEAEALTAAAAPGVDAAYEDEGDEEVEQGGGSKSRKRKSRGGGAGSRGDAAAAAAASSAAAAAAGGAASAAKGDRAAKAVVHRHRNLDYVIAEEEYDSDGPNYKTIAASVKRHASHAARSQSVGRIIVCERRGK